MPAKVRFEEIGASGQEKRNRNVSTASPPPHPGNPRKQLSQGPVSHLDPRCMPLARRLSQALKGISRDQPGFQISPPAPSRLGLGLSSVMVRSLSKPPGEGPRRLPTSRERFIGVFLFQWQHRETNGGRDLIATVMRCRWPGLKFNSEDLCAKTHEISP